MTLYVFALNPVGLMTPVEVLIDRVDENVPPVLPVSIGETAVMFEQTDG